MNLVDTLTFIESAIDIQAYVTKGKGGWYVKSKEGKNLGGPYKSKEKATKRLGQIEYFKHKG